MIDAGVKRSGLQVTPVTLREANEFVLNFHRHNKPTQGGKFAIGAVNDGDLVGVAIVGRPVSATLQDSLTAEVTRVCVIDGAPKNSCSFLYGRCWRIWQQMGGQRIITYTLQSESGASLRGAGWNIKGEVKLSKWNRKSRPREWQPVYGQLKFRWEKQQIS
jgi:hypothetical protein